MSSASKASGPLCRTLSLRGLCQCKSSDSLFGTHPVNSWDPKFTRIGESTRAPSRGILEREHDRDSLKHLMLCRASRWTHQGTRFRGCSVNLSVKPHVHNLPHPSNLPPFTASVLRAYHSLPLPFPSIRDLFDLARWLHRLLLVSHNFGARPAMCTRIGWDGPVKIHPS